MDFAGTRSSIAGNYCQFSSGAGGHRRKRIRVRPLLTVAVGVFLCAILASCGGGFFTHPTLSSTFIDPASASIATGKTAQLTVTGKYSDGSQQGVGGDSVTWSSSDDTIATVTSPGGLVTGVSPGTAVITSTTTAIVPGTGCVVTVSVANGSPTLSKTCSSSSTETLTSTVNVNVTASSVHRAVISTTQGSPVSQSTVTISGAAASLQFYAYGNGDASIDLTQAVTWTSSNDKVATISSGPSGGLATSVAAGTTNITATTTDSAGHQVTSQTIALTVQ